MVFGKKKGIGQYISDGFDAVSEKVGNFAKTKVDLVIDKAEWKLMALQDRIIRKFTYSLLFGVSFVFISFGAFYLLKEFFNLSNTISFFIIGILLFFIGLFIKLNEKVVI